MHIAVVEHQTVRPFELVRQAAGAGHEVTFVTCDLDLYLKGSAPEDTDLRLALMHYAPIPDTLIGERWELFPFLGAQQLGEALDRAGCDLALHGHAHRGTEKGATPMGVPVRNVAQAVLKAPYRVIELAPTRLTRRIPALQIPVSI